MRILPILAFLVFAAAAGAQENRRDPDPWLNSELRRSEAARPRLYTFEPEERDLRAGSDLLGVPGAVQDVLSNDWAAALLETIRDPSKLLDSRPRKYSPEAPHPYEERFRELHEEFQREERRD